MILHSAGKPFPDKHNQYCNDNSWDHKDCYVLHLSKHNISFLKEDVFVWKEFEKFD